MLHRRMHLRRASGDAPVVGGPPKVPSPGQARVPAPWPARVPGWRGAGCEECRQFGYQGRKGIYELLLVNESLRPLILGRAAASTIAARAVDNGMRTLRTDGWNKVKNGETTIEEVLRVTQIEEHMDALAD